MKEKIQLEQWFNRTFANLERDKDTLTSDLENAKKQFPKLMAAYQLLEIYSRFLYQKSKAMTRGLVSYTPIPDGGDEHPFPWLPFPWPPIRERTPIIEGQPIDHELQNWMEANFEAGTQAAIKNRIEVRDCTVVKRERKAATNCIQRFSDRLPQSDEEWDEYRQCISDLERLASETEALGCN